jgi:hypothetical protein
MNGVAETFGFDISAGALPSRELTAWCERFLAPDGRPLKYVFKAEFRRYEDGRADVTVHSYLPVDGARRMITVRDGAGAEHRGVALAQPVTMALTELPPEEIR